jgi:hypothetical protein
MGPAPRRGRGRRLLVVLLVVGGGAAIVAVIVRRMRDLDTTAGTPDPFGAAVAATEDEREHLQHAPTATRH